MKPKQLIIIALSLFTLVAHGQTLNKLQKKELKEAYKYRTDIDKEVQKQTRHWKDGVGVLHSDWIESLQGESIDLQGNTITAPTTEHPPMSQDESLRLDSIDFVTNKWIQLYRKYAQAGDFKNAHFCLQYYHNHEMPFLRSRRSLPNYLVLAYDIDCHAALEEFDILSDVISGKIEGWIPTGLRLSPKNNGFIPDSTLILTPKDSIHLVQMANAINVSYAAYILAYLDYQAHAKHLTVGKALLTGLAAIGVVGLVGVTLVLDVITEGDAEWTSGLFQFFSDINGGGRKNTNMGQEALPKSKKAHPERIRNSGPTDWYK